MRSVRTTLTIAALWLAASAGVVEAQENSWTSHGPTDAGVVYDVAVGDTADYAATVNGVFRSDDGGATWRPSGFEGLPMTHEAPNVGCQQVERRTEVLGVPALIEGSHHLNCLLRHRLSISSRPRPSAG